MKCVHPLLGGLSIMASIYCTDSRLERYYFFKKNKKNIKHGRDESQLRP